MEYIECDFSQLFETECLESTIVLSQITISLLDKFFTKITLDCLIDGTIVITSEEIDGTVVIPSN